MKITNFFIKNWHRLTLGCAIVGLAGGMLYQATKAPEAEIVSTANGDPLATERAAWTKKLNQHPYNNHLAYNKQDWKKMGLARQDRPDFAFEQDFLRTMNPKTGQVPYEAKEIANQIARRYWRSGTKNLDALAISWTERGPNNIGGRTRAVMFDPNDVSRKKLWAGGVGGGLWVTNDITTNSGWTKVNDLWDNIAISCIAHDPRAGQTRTFYVGTGEGYFGGGAVRGAGIWRSTDGGSTWARMAGTDLSNDNFHFVQKMVVNSSGVVFAATRGSFTNRGGIMRFDPATSTWTKVLAPRSGVGVSADENTSDWGCDIELASNGDLYVSMGHAFNNGKIYKSTDNGTSWTELTNAVKGTPTRIEMSVSPSNPNVIYALAQAQSPTDNNRDLEFFRKSTDGGTTWADVTIPPTRDQPVSGCGLTNEHFTRGQAFWDLTLTVHPTNPDLVIIAGIDAHRTLDGGKTWNDISLWINRNPENNCGKGYIHADIHEVLFRPGNSNEVVFGSDGGLDYSPNAGNASTATPTMESRITDYNVTQFYAGDIAATAGSDLIIGGAQDNGTLLTNGTGIKAATSPSGGDGAFCFISKKNSNIRISSYTNCNYYRTNTGQDAGFEEITSSSPLKGNGSFINPAEYDSENDILYANLRGGGNNTTTEIFRISKLGTDAPDIGALAITGATPGENAVTHLKMSPYTNHAMFLGLANGNLLKVTNLNGTPVGTSITGPMVGSVSCIDVGANENQLLVTYTNYGLTSQVWETSDGGATWTNKKGTGVGALPDMPVRWALYNPENRNQVMLATEIGCWSSDNFGAGTTGVPVWGSSNQSLANTRCDMMKYRASDKMVLIATHGRGMYTAFPFSTPNTPKTPTITVAGSNLAAFSACAGSVSTEQQYTVSGADLTANITVTAPTGFEVSTTTGTGFASSITLTQTGGTVASTNIFVRQTTAAANGASGNITHTSTGATTQNRAIPTSAVNPIPTITVGAIAEITTTATSFSLPYTATGSPNQYSITAGANALAGFTAVNNASLSGSPLTVNIPASAVGTYNFNLTVRNSATSCASTTVPFTVTVATTPAPTPPSITVSAAALTAFSACSGSASSEQQYTVSGANLTANITVTAPTGFEVSTTSGSGFASSVNLAANNGSVANTNIFVRQSSSAANGASGNITHTSTGATAQNKAIPTSSVNPIPTVSVGAIAEITTTATSFSLPYTITGSPNQYSISVGANALSGFSAVSNASLSGSPLTVNIPASAAGTYSFNLTVRNSSTGCASTSVPFTVTIKEDVTTGIEDPILSAKLLVFPNPLRDKLTMELGLEKLGKINIKLVDVTGRVVIDTNISPKELKFKQEIDFSTYAQGVYTLLLNVDGKTAVKRLVKE
jgi:hypothetical protein